MAADLGALAWAVLENLTPLSVIPAKAGIHERNDASLAYYVITGHVAVISIRKADHSSGPGWPGQSRPCREEYRPCDSAHPGMAV
jgi:hypothetical protein